MVAHFHRNNQIENFESLLSQLQTLSIDTDQGEFSNTVSKNNEERVDFIKDLKQYDNSFKKQLSHLRYFSSIENDELEALNDLQGHYNEQLTQLAKVDQRWIEVYEQILTLA